MKKVISLFKRDYEGTRLVYDEIVEGAEWVIKGEGLATEKIDGTSCLFKDGKLFKRYDAKKGKNPPSGFIPAQDEPDKVTGHWPGWLEIGEGPDDKYYREGLKSTQETSDMEDGMTYELVGPKIGSRPPNPYGLTFHYLRKHGDVVLQDVPRDFEGIRHYLSQHPQYEGIVWHHFDGRMVKIKRKDFDLSWFGRKECV